MEQIILISELYHQFNKGFCIDAYADHGINPGYLAYRRMAWKMFIKVWYSKSIFNLSVDGEILIFNVKNIIVLRFIFVEYGRNCSKK